jgi:hypothetical protein
MPPWNAAKWLSGIGLLVAVAGCGSTTDDRPATWAFIAPAIIQPSCATASCHSDVAQRAGVNLYEPDVAYDSLLTRHFVIPSAPDTSELMALIRAEGSRRMPPDFALPADDIALIEKWITAGAKQ